MFRSATTKLTGWYLLILMLISTSFSIIIYQVATNEVQARLERFQTNLQESQPPDGPTNPPAVMTLRSNEEALASTNLSIMLLNINLFVLVVGGVISYILARNNLIPIEKAHEEQSRFTSDASHELRTPLAAMKAEIEVALRDKNATTNDLKEILSSNLEEVNKLSKLSEMLLSLSRLDNDKIKLTEVNLPDVAKVVVKDFHRTPKPRIAFILDKKLVVYGNEMALADLIKILIDNAIQYSPKDSQINIKVSKDDNNAKFEITNIGPGIQPDMLPHIFERFYRADLSRTCSEQKGYGLGLALAKNIVELHNGRLFASSQPNHETTFSFLLPLYDNVQAKNKK